MTRIGILLGCAALAAATPGNAQLLGGGGGIGGGIGGGLGGTMGNVGGSVGGSLRSERLGDVARADRARSRELRAERRRAERAGRNGSSGAGGSLSNGAASLAGGGNGDGNFGRVSDTAGLAGTAGDRAVREIPGGLLNGAASLAGSASSEGNFGRMSGSANVAGTAGDRAVNEIPSRSYAVRTDAKAGTRGLRRAGHSASGVSVYLPVKAVGVPFAVAQLYPVYGGGYAYGAGYVGGSYYGGSDVVVDQAYMDRQYRDLRDDTAGTGVTVERRGEDLVVQLPADITFAFDRADIQPRFVAALDAVAQTIAEYRGTDVEIVGHTDSVGSDAYNYVLSQRRGTTVADFLVSRRAAPDRMIVAAMGETEPVATNANIAGRAANRRVEIILRPRAA